jgi:hypothetical protein
MGAEAEPLGAGSPTQFIRVMALVVEWFSARWGRDGRLLRGDAATPEIGALARGPRRSPALLCLPIISQLSRTAYHVPQEGMKGEGVDTFLSSVSQAILCPLAAARSSCSVSHYQG